MHACSATPYGIAHGLYGLVLTDYTLVQFILQVQQFLAFALHHLLYGDARPTAYDIGYIISSNLLFQHSFCALGLFQLLLGGLYILLQLLQLAVANLSYLGIVALTFGSLSLKLQAFYLLFVLLDVVQQVLLALPLLLEVILLRLQFLNLLVQCLQLGLVALTLDGLTFNLQLFQTTAYLIQFLWYRVAFHTQLGSCLVHQVYGLVRQETFCNVTCGQLYGGYDGIILYTYVVMVLVALLQTTQDADAGQTVGLVHHNGLEPTLQCLIHLKVLLVLIQCSGAYAAQFSSCQGRLQDVGSIHGALALACAHQRVYLIYE